MAAATVTTGHLTTLWKEIAGAMTEMAEVYSIGGPDASATMIDVTHLTSPDRAREFIGGLVDWGAVTAEIAYIPGNAVIEAITAELSDTAIAANENEWRIDIGGSTTERWTFPALVQSFSPRLNLDDKKTATLVLKLTGKPTVVPT